MRDSQPPTFILRVKFNGGRGACRESSQEHSSSGRKALHVWSKTNVKECVEEKRV